MLFLDLDSVIVDNIDGYFEYGGDEDVITARNWIKPWVWSTTLFLDTRLGLIRICLIS